MSYDEFFMDRRYSEIEQGFWSRLNLPVKVDKQDPERFWKHVPSLRALELLVKEEPLTPEGLELVGKFVQVSTSWYEETGAVGLCAFYGFNEDFPIYKAFVNLALCRTEVQQKETLFHEMCHIYYRTAGGREVDIEDIIENESLRFLSEEPNYVNSAFARFSPILGYSYVYSTNQLALPFSAIDQNL